MPKSIDGVSKTELFNVRTHPTDRQALDRTVAELKQLGMVKNLSDYILRQVNKDPRFRRHLKAVREEYERSQDITREDLSRDSTASE